MDKIPVQDKYKNALKGDTDLDKQIVKFGELNEITYKELILSINTSSSVEKVAFAMVRNTKRADFLEGSCKIAWERLVCKYAPHTALSLLKL